MYLTAKYKCPLYAVTLINASSVPIILNVQHFIKLHNTVTFKRFIVKKKEYEKLSPILQSKVRVLAIQEDKILFVREFG